MRIQPVSTRARSLFVGLTATLLGPAWPAAAQDYRFLQLSETVTLEQALGSPASPFGRFGHDIGAVGDTTGDGNDDVVLGLINAPDPEQGYLYASKPMLLTYDAATGRYALDNGFTQAAPSRIFVRRASIRDFTGDGRKDVFLGTTGGDSIWGLPDCGEQNSLMINGAAGWQDGSPHLPQEADYTHGMAGGDFNGDGADDMLVVNSEYITKRGCGAGHAFTNATYLLQFNADPVTSAGPADVQAWLATLGYDPGPVDGQPGRKTMAALAAFYADRQGQFDGTLDGNEAADLTAALAARTGTAVGPLVRKMALKAPQRYLDLNPAQGFDWENYSALAHDVDGDGVPELFLGSGDRTVILAASDALDYALAAKFDHPAEFATAIEDANCQRVQSGRCATPVSDFVALDIDGDGQDEVISALTSGNWEGRYFQVFDLVEGTWQDVTATVFPVQVPDLRQNSAWCWSLWSIDLTLDGRRDMVCANGSDFTAYKSGQIWINEAGTMTPFLDTKMNPNLLSALRDAGDLPGRRQRETKTLGYQVSLAGVARINGKETLLFLEKFWSPPDQASIGSIRLYGLQPN